MRARAPVGAAHVPGVPKLLLRTRAHPCVPAQVSNTALGSFQWRGWAGRTGVVILQAARTVRVLAMQLWPVLLGLRCVAACAIT